jgi:hypothetical protein
VRRVEFVARYVKRSACCNHLTGKENEMFEAQVQPVESGGESLATLLVELLEDPVEIRLAELKNAGTPYADPEWLLLRRYLAYRRAEGRDDCETLGAIVGTALSVFMNDRLQKCLPCDEFKPLGNAVVRCVGAERIAQNCAASSAEQVAQSLEQARSEFAKLWCIACAEVPQFAGIRQATWEEILKDPGLFEVVLLCLWERTSVPEPRGDTPEPEGDAGFEIQ